MAGPCIRSVDYADVYRDLGMSMARIVGSYTGFDRDAYRQDHPTDNLQDPVWFCRGLMEHLRGLIAAVEQTGHPMRWECFPAFCRQWFEDVDRLERWYFQCVLRARWQTSDTATR